MIDRMNSYSCCLRHIHYGRGYNANRRCNWYKLFRPEIVANAQWQALTNLYVFQRDPLILACIELMLIGTFQHKAAPCAQADSRGIATNVTVSNLISCSTATPHCHHFASSQELM